MLLGRLEEQLSERWDDAELQASHVETAQRIEAALARWEELSERSR